MIKSVKSASALKLFGVVGGLAVVLVGTSGCIRIVNHDTDGQESVADSSQSAEASEGKMVYSITGVEVHDSWHGNGEKVAVIRWHAVNNRTSDAYADPYGFKVYQNKQVLSSSLATDLDDTFEMQELAPGGEFDGTATFEINDMSPIEVKYSDYTNRSNELDMTFNLE